MLYQFGFVLLVAAAATGPASANEVKHWTVDDLCAERVTQFDTLSQIKRLDAELVLGKQHKGCIKTRKALSRLGELVATLGKPKYVCTSLVSRDLHLIKRDHIKKDAMPEAMANFAKALAYRLSASCKGQLLGHLEKFDAATIGYMGPVEELEKAGAMIFDESVVPKHTDLLRIAAELMLLTRSSGYPMTEDELLASVQNPQKGKEFLHSLRSHCESVYRPLYKPVLEMPVEMGQYGFDYSVEGALLTDQAQAMKSSPKLKRWLSIMITCEALVFSTNSVGKQQPVRDSVAKLTFEPPIVEDSTVVDQGKLTETLKLARVSKREARKLARQIYKRITGKGSLSLDTWQMDERVFIQSLMTYVDIRRSKCH